MWREVKTANKIIYMEEASLSSLGGPVRIVVETAWHVGEVAGARLGLGVVGVVVSVVSKDIYIAKAIGSRILISS